VIQVVPVLYIKGGRAVLPKESSISSTVQLDESPVELTRKFLDHGLTSIFVIDMDGLAAGSPQNFSILLELAHNKALDITYGGGISSYEDVSNALENGASKITASSVAVKQSDVFSSWLIGFGRRKIVLSADVIDNKIARLGESKPLETNIIDFIEYFYLRGIHYVKCSDIAQKNAYTGPSLTLYKNLKSTFPDIELTAGGGVKHIEDFQKLEDVGVSSVLVGKAFYDGTLSLKEVEKAIQAYAL